LDESHAADSSNWTTYRPQGTPVNRKSHPNGIIFVGKLSYSVKELRDRLRSVFASEGWMTYEDMAKNLGENYQTIRRYVGGFENRSPTLDFIAKVCLALDVSPTWLLFGEGGKKIDQLSSIPFDQLEDVYRSREKLMREFMRNLQGIQEKMEKRVAEGKAKRIIEGNEVRYIEKGFGLIDETGLMKKGKP
jgi:transcriptional regulator with XRE-family HTH domain